MVVFKATKTVVILSIRAVFKFKATTYFVCWFKFRKVASQNRATIKISILCCLYATKSHSSHMCYALFLINLAV